MEFSGIGPNTTTADQRKEVAEQIAAIIQMSGIEVFRQAVQQVTCDRLKTEDERERREEARREALKEIGVLYRNGAIPDRPEGDWYFHQDILGGYVKLPSKVELPPNQPERPKPPACLRDPKLRKDWDDADKKAVDRFHAEEAKYNKRIQAFWPKWQRAIRPLFEQVKKRGFPNDDDGDYRYGFDLCCWLPRELHPANDPRNEELLPVPRRELTEFEKIAILAAVYDAHWRGSEKVAPWGLSEDGSAPDGLQPDAERDERRAALDYFWLFQKAQQLDDSDLDVVESWLGRLPKAIETKRTDLRVKVHAETKVIEIDGMPYPLSGSDQKKERMVEFIQALISAEGSPVSAQDYKLRSRNVEGQHDKIKTLIGDDAKPGSGFRIPREKLMA